MSITANSEQGRQMMLDFEIGAMTEMYTKMVNVCHQKCVPRKYSDSDLPKGETVCLDRCAAKYFEFYENVGKKFAAINAPGPDEQSKLKM